MEESKGSQVRSVVPINTFSLDIFWNIPLYLLLRKWHLCFILYDPEQYWCVRIDSGPLARCCSHLPGPAPPRRSLLLYCSLPFWFHPLCSTFSACRNIINRTTHFNYYQTSPIGIIPGIIRSLIIDQYMNHHGINDPWSRCVMRTSWTVSWDKLVQPEILNYWPRVPSQFQLVYIEWDTLVNARRDSCPNGLNKPPQRLSI